MTKYAKELTLKVPHKLQSQAKTKKASRKPKVKGKRRHSATCHEVSYLVFAELIVVLTVLTSRRRTALLGTAAPDCSTRLPEAGRHIRSI
jgi:hypothetical protein